MAIHHGQEPAAQQRAADRDPNTTAKSRTVTVTRIRRLTQEARIEVDGRTEAELREALVEQEQDLDWSTIEADTEEMVLDGVVTAAHHDLARTSPAEQAQTHAEVGDEAGNGSADRTAGYVAQEMLHELRSLLPGREDRFLDLCEEMTALLSESKTLPGSEELEFTHQPATQGAMVAVVEFVLLPGAGSKADDQHTLFALRYIGHANTSTAAAEAEVLAHVLKAAALPEPTRYEHLVTFQAPYQPVAEQARWCETLHGRPPA